MRFHAFEFLVGAAIGVPVVLAFGLPAPVLAFCKLLDVAVTMFSHSNTRLPPAIDH